MVTHERAQFDSAGTDVERASEMVTRMENLISFRDKLSLPEVRRPLSRRLRITTGTLLHIRKQRRKSIPAFLMSAIRQELIAVLQSEVARLEHEIHIHRQVAGSHRTDDLALAEAQVVEAKKTLRLAAR